MTNEEIVDYLEDNATFVKPTARGHVWEFQSLEAAKEAIEKIGPQAGPYNWDPIQQPNGPTVRAGQGFVFRKPTIYVDFVGQPDSAASIGFCLLT